MSKKPFIAPSDGEPVIDRGRVRSSEPLFVPGQPVTPADEHHGRGGLYAVIDGVRLPCDEQGQPLGAELSPDET